MKSFNSTNSRSLARTSLSFQPLPRWVLHLITRTWERWGEAYGRINHDRSFDAHISLLNEDKFVPKISIGLRDFIGTGWYSSEYIVGTKTIGELELSVGLGFGRLAGHDQFKNPLGSFSKRFLERGEKSFGLGGSLGNINWFQGPASFFGGLNYPINEKFKVTAEYSSDKMDREAPYLNIESRWSYGLSYELNKLQNSV